jgi:hypothetical protein
MNGAQSLDPLRDDVAALRRHVESRLTETPLERSPFPHLVIDEFFPAAVYADILRFNPFRENGGSEWLPREQSANVSTGTPYFARKQIDLAKEQPFEAAPDARAFWDALRTSFLAGDWFARRVFERYEEYFVIRFGDLAAEPDFFALLSKQLFLQRHEPGFSIGAHTDLPTRIFTCIFSFADREGFERYGTELLAPDDRLVRCWGVDHHPRDRFAVCKVAPYRPNSALLFFKTRHSFHAVPPIDESVPNQRYGMQFQLHEPSGGIFADLSAPKLMHFQRES